jgi:pyrimidine operon attenuation protein/uracil phosphoribosyltransferase
VPARNERILDDSEIDAALRRIAREIVDRNPGGGGLGLVGIRTRGLPLAERLAAEIARTLGTRVEVGALDINLYRDDLERIAAHPVLRKTEIPFEVDASNIVLVDDVLFTGRTIRAALDGLMDLGRPDRVELAVLVDRGHREVPIHPDYVGHVVDTARDDVVEVRLGEIDGADEVVLVRNGAGGAAAR